MIEHDDNILHQQTYCKFSLDIINSLIFFAFANFVNLLYDVVFCIYMIFFIKQLEPQKCIRMGQVVSILGFISNLMSTDIKFMLLAFIFIL